MDPLMTEAAAVLELPERLRPAGGQPRSYLATGGLAKCGPCGEPLEAKPSSRGTRGYACIKVPETITASGRKRYAKHGCGRIRIAAEPLEQDIGARVLAKLATPDAVQHLAALMVTSAHTGSALAVKIGTVENELRQLGADLGAGRVNRTAFLAAQGGYDSRLRALRAQVQNNIAIGSLAELVTPEQLAAWWETGSTVQERHDLVRVFVDEIRILPAKRPRGFHGFDSDRVEYVWATG